jgi:hypothetical protein
MLSTVEIGTLASFHMLELSNCPHAGFFASIIGPYLSTRNFVASSMMWEV